MKKLFALLLLLPLLASSSLGNVPCTLPFNLQNGTPADATQVMANYNALVNCLAQAASQGVNNDITALTALTTPIPPQGGGTPVFTGGTSGGAANAQTVTTTPTFTATLGYEVTFTAGFTNTGPTTLTVGTSPAINVYRRTQLGISALVGGEIIVGHRITVAYDGTQFQLLGGAPALVGEVRDFTGTSTTAPLGWAFIDGSCQLRAGAFADLFSVIGTTYDPTGSTCDVAHFALPDGRGRLLAGRDNMGVGAANRMTTAGSGCNGVALGGAGCGVQTTTITSAAQLASHLHAVIGNTAGESNDHSHSFSGTTSGQSNDHTHSVQALATGSPTQLTGGGSIGPATNQTIVTSGTSLDHSHNYSGTTSGVNVDHTHGINFNSQATGSSAPIPSLNPLQVVNKIIKM